MLPGCLAAAVTAVPLHARRPAVWYGV